MSLLEIDPLPARYSKRWLWTEWSHTGSDPRTMAYVYLMGRDDPYYKIGASNDPIRRVAELTWTLSRRIYIVGMWLHPNAGRLEEFCHRKLAHCRHPHELEWFRAEPQVLMDVVMAGMRAVKG